MIFAGTIQTLSFVVTLTSSLAQLVVVDVVALPLPLVIGIEVRRLGL